MPRTILGTSTMSTPRCSSSQRSFGTASPLSDVVLGLLHWLWDRFVLFVHSSESSHDHLSRYRVKIFISHRRVVDRHLFAGAVRSLPSRFPCTSYCTYVATINSTPLTSAHPPVYFLYHQCSKDFVLCVV